MMTKDDFSTLFEICQGVYEYHEQPFDRELVLNLICDFGHLNAMEVCSVITGSIDEVKRGNVEQYLGSAFRYREKQEDTVVSGVIH